MAGLNSRAGVGRRFIGAWIVGLCLAVIAPGCGSDDDAEKAPLHCCMLSRFCSTCPPTRCTADDRTIANSANDQACEEALHGGSGCELGFIGSGDWYYSDNARAECSR